MTLLSKQHNIMMYIGCLSSLLVVLQVVCTVVKASAGDRSWSFNKCLQECLSANCSNQEQFVNHQPVHLRLLGWHCHAECQYDCMWKTVDDFHKDGTKVPQFYGKWPFVRLFGIQEPASAIFSVLNGFSHILMLRYFRSKVTSAAPMFYIWHIYSLSAINAWIWSTVFHIRDTNFTELMDYFSAMLMVLVSLFTVCVRLPRLPYRRWCGGCAAIILLSFYIYHVHYLAFIDFDYSYNMKANLTAGILNAFGWVLWSLLVRKQQPYVWKAVVSILLLSGLILLEVWDFPPLWWTFDAHSLWHAGTILIPLLWYQFLVDDSRYELNKLSADELVTVETKKQR
jgi:hypothetical protein